MSQFIITFFRFLTIIMYLDFIYELHTLQHHWFQRSFYFQLQINFLRHLTFAHQYFYLMLHYCLLMSFIFYCFRLEQNSFSICLILAFEFIIVHFLNANNTYLFVKNKLKLAYCVHLMIFFVIHVPFLGLPILISSPNSLF